MKKTAEEIIDETIDIYKHPENRSTNEVGGCRYLGLRGCVCAFSRIIKPEFRSELKEGMSVFHQNNVINSPNKFVDGYYGHPLYVYQVSQIIHDRILAPGFKDEHDANNEEQIEKYLFDLFQYESYPDHELRPIIRYAAKKVNPIINPQQ